MPLLRGGSAGLTPSPEHLSGNKTAALSIKALPAAGEIKEARLSDTASHMREKLRKKKNSNLVPEASIWMLGDRCAFSLMSFSFFENWVSFEAFITLRPRSPAHGDAGLRLERESAGLPGVLGAMVTLPRTGPPACAWLSTETGRSLLLPRPGPNNMPHLEPSADPCLWELPLSRSAWRAPLNVCQRLLPHEWTCGTGDLQGPVPPSRGQKWVTWAPNCSGFVNRLFFPETSESDPGHALGKRSLGREGKPAQDPICLLTSSGPVTARPPTSPSTEEHTALQL